MGLRKPINEIKQHLSLRGHNKVTSSDAAYFTAKNIFFLKRKQRKKTYTSVCLFLTGNFLSSQGASTQVLSAFKGLTTVFGMGTGGTP